MRKRLLFILKRRDSYWGVPSQNSNALGSGLSNSVRFVVDMLTRHGVEARMVEVVDNNSIDREVTAYQPTHVIIEAFWMVPEKLDVLKPLHPRVRWIVRDHSETPFLANEGIAFGWTVGYLQRGAELMCNSPRAQDDMRHVAAAHGLPEALITYGPNVYPEPAALGITPHLDHKAAAIDVGCFGAIRPLKNHMSQAIAALAFGDAARKPVRFHVNATRIEGGGDPIIKNLRALFAGSHGHKLIEHGWMTHDAFLAVMRTMAFSMQVSFTETFNIVSADAMATSVPLVTSPDVPWVGAYAHANPNSVANIAGAMLRIWDETPSTFLVRLHQQRRDLMHYSHASAQVWLTRFGN